MSKLEKPLIEKYWHQIGGTIKYEFSMVRRSETNGPRYLDALILPEGKKEVFKGRSSEIKNMIKGKDIIIVQAKKGRLGMYLMGQAIFSIDLMKQFQPKSILSVALCFKDDSILKPLLRRYSRVKVVVLGESSRLAFRRKRQEQGRRRKERTW